MYLQIKTSLREKDLPDNESSLQGKVIFDSNFYAFESLH